MAQTTSTPFMDHKSAQVAYILHSMSTSHPCIVYNIIYNLNHRVHIVIYNYIYLSICLWPIYLCIAYMALSKAPDLYEPPEPRPTTASQPLATARGLPAAAPSPSSAPVPGSAGPAAASGCRAAPVDRSCQHFPPVGTHLRHRCWIKNQLKQWYLPLNHLRQR